MVAAVSLAAATLAASPSAATGLTSQLDAGHRWMLASAGEQSPSGRFELFLYPDGGGIELDEVVHTNQAIAWKIQPGDINRNCRRGYLAMQTNGNLVDYCRPGDPLWSTHTAGTGHHNSFELLNNGNMVVRTAAGRTVWSAGSTRPMLLTGEQLTPGQRLRTKEYLNHRWVSLTMERGGNVVLTYGARVAWTSGTHNAGSRLMLLRDGNLVVEGPHGHTLWSSHTVGAGAGTLLNVFDEGEVAVARITGGGGGIRWSRSG